MTTTLTTTPTAAEGEALLLASARYLETQLAVAQAADGFEAYWADSVSASVLRDYKAGRIVNVGRER